MTRERLLQLLAALLLLAAGAWLASALEWVEVDVPRPPEGEAARNRFYAAQKLLRALGASASSPKDLDRMPPRGARLILESNDWDLLPGRADRLRRWVEEGGHLVVPTGFGERPSVATWLSIDFKDIPAARDRPARSKDNCQTVDSGPPGGPQESMWMCNFHRPYTVELRGRVATWMLQDAQGIHALRVAVGRGDVTLVGPWNLQYNQPLPKGDNALVLTRILQLEPGAVTWFVTSEDRDPLLLWIWSHAWFAVLLALAALAAALWRGAVRFGPQGATPALPRRSIAEQVRGTAQFLRRHGPASLHAAGRRALDEAARARLPATAPLEAPQRLAAVARAAAIEPAALELALQAPARKGAGVAPALALMETARRALLRNRRNEKRSS